MNEISYVRDRMSLQTKTSSLFLLQTKPRFHHNKVVIVNIAITLLLSLFILYNAIIFNNNSIVLYSSSYSNDGQQDIIQIHSDFSTKIHFTSLCNKYFDSMVNIQIISNKGTDTYSFEAFCTQDFSGNAPTDQHSAKSYFVSGNYNLTINYDTVKWIAQNVQLFTLNIQEYRGSLRDIQINDNLIFPFSLLSGVCFLIPLFYFVLNNTTWDQINEISIFKREKRRSKEENTQDKSIIDCRFVKIPSFIKNRRLFFVIFSYLLLYLISAGNVGTAEYLVYSTIIILLIIYESVPHPNIDYIVITPRYLSFIFRTNKSFILDKDKIQRLRFEIVEIETSEGRTIFQGIILESKDGEIYHLNLNRKLIEIVTKLHTYGWIEEEEQTNDIKKLKEKNESLKKKLLKLYYYYPVICEACKTENDLLDLYCKECGRELQKKVKYEKSIVKKAILLLSVYLAVDIPVIFLSYALFSGFMQNIYLDYDILSPNFPSSTAFNELFLFLTMIAITLFIIHTKLFGKFLPKMVISKATAEYSALYLGVPFLHGILYIGICIILRYNQLLDLFVITYMIFISESFLFVFSLTYRIMKIVFKVNYLNFDSHFTKEDKMKLVEENNRRMQEKKRLRELLKQEKLSKNRENERNRQ